MKIVAWLYSRELHKDPCKAPCQLVYRPARASTRACTEESVFTATPCLFMHAISRRNLTAKFIPGSCNMRPPCPSHPAPLICGTPVRPAEELHRQPRAIHHPVCVGVAWHVPKHAVSHLLPPHLIACYCPAWVLLFGCQWIMYLPGFPLICDFRKVPLKYVSEYTVCIFLCPLNGLVLKK